MGDSRNERPMDDPRRAGPAQEEKLHREEFVQVEAVRVEPMLEELAPAPPVMSNQAAAATAAAARAKAARKNASVAPREYNAGGGPEAPPAAPPPLPPPTGTALLVALPGLHNWSALAAAPEAPASSLLPDEDASPWLPPR